MIINKKYFAENAPIPINFDQTEIRLYLDVASKIWLIPIIGQDFYDEIEEQVENNTLSEENATLLTDGGLWRYLCYATCLEGLTFLWARITEVGIVLNKTEQSESITMKDLTYIESHLRRQTEFLKDALIKWLCQRQDSFPLLPESTCQCGCGCNTTTCGCESHYGKLNSPNPYKIAYSTLRKNTDIK